MEFIFHFGVNSLSYEKNIALLDHILGYIEENKGFMGGGFCPTEQTNEGRKPKLDETDFHYIVHPRKGKGRVVIPKDE